MLSKSCTLVTNYLLLNFPSEQHSFTLHHCLSFTFLHLGTWLGFEISLVTSSIIPARLTDAAFWNDVLVRLESLSSSKACWSLQVIVLNSAWLLTQFACIRTCTSLMDQGRQLCCWITFLTPLAMHDQLCADLANCIYICKDFYRAIGYAMQILTWLIASLQISSSWRNTNLMD